MRFQVLEHTADKEIRAFGGDLKELFENAAFGMFSLMADLTAHSPTEIRKIEMEAEDREELLRAWLAELLYQFEVDQVLFVDFDVEEIANGRVKATVKGVPFDVSIEWLGSPVKAVTHHNLSVRRFGDHWEATVVFDV